MKVKRANDFYHFLLVQSADKKAWAIELCIESEIRINQKLWNACPDPVLMIEYLTLTYSKENINNENPADIEAEIHLMNTLSECRYLPDQSWDLKICSEDKDKIEETSMGYRGAEAVTYMSMLLQHVYDIAKKKFCDVIRKNYPICPKIAKRGNK